MKPIKTYRYAIIPHPCCCFGIYPAGIVLCGCQLVLFVLRPRDGKRFWFLVLLLLLLLYNFTNGHFPDPGSVIPLKLQYILADGTGYLMGAYFPFYFYKVFELDRLRYHATYGVALFILLPYVLFDVVFYMVNGNLLFDREIGVIIPGIYGLLHQRVFFRKRGHLSAKTESE